MTSVDGTSGPVALVTGANRGTGLAIARELRARGYRVAALNRTRLGEAWLDEFRCDLTEPDSVELAATAVLERFGRLDACVANAAVRVLAPIADLCLSSWTDALAVNLTSVVRLVRATLPAMRASHGTYVVMGSHAGSRYFEGGAAYGSAKAALKAFVETLLLEERANGVRATLVRPGAIANRSGDESPYKMSTRSVARCVGFLIQDLPSDLAIGDVEMRPAALPVPEVSGLTRLHYV